MALEFRCMAVLGRSGLEVCEMVFRLELIALE